MILPSYISLYKSGKLKNRLKSIKEYASPCNLCPNMCNVFREKGEKGICKSPYEPVVASYNLHFGEEPPLVGSRGAGTIFFSGCSLHCIYCQNYPISHYNVGKTISVKRLAEIMVKLQKQGAANIDLVTPTHYIHAIVEALPMAIEMGLSIPLVYNSSGYERIEVLKLLEGIIDIYLPDAKYGDDKIGKRYSRVPNYHKVNKTTLKEMVRETGINLLTEQYGLASKGTIIRHLVLPNNIENSKKVLKFIHDEISPDIPISLMSQYFPAYLALKDRTINRRLFKREYEEIKEYAISLGLKNVWIQEIG